jgi:hypothetical protein
MLQKLRSDFPSLQVAEVLHSSNLGVLEQRLSVSDPLQGLRQPGPGNFPLVQAQEFPEVCNHGDIQKTSNWAGVPCTSY